MSSDSESDSKLVAAITDRDVTQLRQLILAGEFVLISISDPDDEEDGYSALTAEIDDFEALVVFTSEEIAGEFVREQSDVFGDDDEVEGIVVDGNGLLEYLPEGFGMLVDPERDDAAVIDPSLAVAVLGEPG